MSDKLRESVSAVMDGEADDLELRRVLASADRAEVRTAWRDYHLQREALSGGDLQFAQVDISAGVWAAIAKEDQAVSATPAAQRSQARWVRPLTSFAVAASVAAIVVVGVRGMGGADLDAGAPSLADVQPGAATVAPAAVEASPALLPAAVEGGVPVAASVTGTATAVTVSAGDEVAKQHLDRYLQGHTERAASESGQGVMSFARVPQLDAE